MKNRNISIYAYLNIILLFFLCCKFSPISNHLTSSIFSSVIVNYLIIVFNIVIGMYTYNKSDDRHKKINAAILVNSILALIYICSVLVDYTVSFKCIIVQIMVSVCSYLICYTTVMKLSSRKYFLMLLLFSLFATILIGEVQYLKTLDLYSEKKCYSFANEDLYNKYKKLYDTFEEIPPYIVLDNTDNSVYVQDLTSGKTDYYSFESKKEKEDFVTNHTMGINVIIPKFGTDVSFNDSEYEVYYMLSFSEMDIIDGMKQTSSKYFSILMGFLIIVSIMGFLYEKNRKI